MRIAIVSDLHLGYERFEEDAYAQARGALNRAAAMADAILIPGDIFDKRAPKPEAIAQAINIFRALSRLEWGARVLGSKSQGLDRDDVYTSVPIIAIPGTHERTAEGRENALRLLSLAGLLVDTSEAVTTIAKGDERVAVFGLGGVSEERVRERLKALDPKPVDGAFNVFMFHQSVYELLPFNDEFIHYDDLPAGFDLYVNGHIHSTVEATAHSKPLLIPGSTVLTQLKEGEQAPKGFFIFDTTTGKHAFERIDSRPFIVIRVMADGDTPSQLQSRCDDEISKALAGTSAKPIVRLVVEGTIAEGFAGSDLPLHALSSKYSQKAFLDLNVSALKSRQQEHELEELREGKVGGLSIKEMGMGMLGARLRASGFDSRLDFQELFNLLASPQSKEKVVRAATEYIESIASSSSGAATAQRTVADDGE